MGKKKSNLSKEEALAQALVPESEWPYQVPGNWVWVRLGAVVSVSKDKKDQFDEEDLKYVGLEHLESDCGLVGFGAASSIRSLKNVFRRGNILYGKLRPYLNKHDIAPFDGVCSTDILVLKPANSTNAKYVNYLLGTSELLEFAVNNSKGINLPRVSENELLSFPAPLPPLAEQQRIVDRVESLFEKLDQAKGLIQESLDSFENRRAAILHKAFSGELTKKWREENGVGMESWETLKFSDVAEIKSNLVDPFNYLDMPHIAPDNIQKYTGKLLDYRTIREDNVKSSKHRFYAGQILYSKIRPYLSKAVIVDFDGLCSADMYPVETTENTKYLWYFMLSEEFIVQASSAGSRSVLPKINQKELSQVKVKVPEMDEQIKIVELLECILDEDESAQELCNVLDTIEKMKKTILARAFRGELDTDDPAEESILVLLDELVINRQ